MFRNFRKLNEILSVLEAKLELLFLNYEKKSWQPRNSWLVALFMSNNRAKLDDSHGNKIERKLV